MKIKNRSSILLLFLFAINFISCSNDDDNKERIITPFKLEKQSYEVMYNGREDIRITNGSGDISLSVENDRIISASYTNASTDEYMGYIHLNGGQKGKTTLTVTDKGTQETETLTITVIDTYMVYPIEESNHPALTNGTLMYLVNNTARDCYFFRYLHAGNKVSDTPIAKGTYRFKVEKKEVTGTTPYLILTYASDGEGKFTDAAIPPTDHIFDISHSTQAAYSLMDHYLDANWDGLIENASTKGDLIVSTTLNMKEAGTEYATRGDLNIAPRIPENILK